MTVWSGLRVFMATTAVAVSLGAAAPQAAELTTVRYALLTAPGIWDAGVIAAIDNGFFEAEGLKVELISPTTPADGMKLAVSGGAEFATVHSTDVIIARGKGVPVVSIAANHQYGTSGVMVPSDAGVASLKDLEGKTIGVTGIPFNQTMLEHSLKSAGADLSKVQIVTVGFTQIPLLLSGRIDALGDAITWSEAATYNIATGHPAGDTATYEFFAFQDNGVPRFYTLGIVADEQALAADPERARHFLAGWQKGLQWAIDNQEAAVDNFIKHYPSTNRAEALANFAEIARIAVSPETKEHGLGWQDVANWKAQEAFMREAGILAADVDVTKAVTNEYLPAQ